MHPDMKRIHFHSASKPRNSRAIGKVRRCVFRPMTISKVTQSKPCEKNGSLGTFLPLKKKVAPCPLGKPPRGNTSCCKARLKCTIYQQQRKYSHRNETSVETFQNDAGWWCKKNHPPPTHFLTHESSKLHGRRRQREER